MHHAMTFISGLQESRGLWEVCRHSRIADEASRWPDGWNQAGGQGRRLGWPLHWFPYNFGKRRIHQVKTLKWQTYIFRLHTGNHEVKVEGDEGKEKISWSIAMSYCDLDKVTFKKIPVRHCYSYSTWKMFSNFFAGFEGAGWKGVEWGDWLHQPGRLEHLPRVQGAHVASQVHWWH